MVNEPATSVDPPAFEVAAPPPALDPGARQVHGEATNRRRWFTASLAIAVLLTGGGLALLYNDDRAFQDEARSLTTENESLQGQIIGIQGELTATNGKLSTSQTDLAAVRAGAPAPGDMERPPNLAGSDLLPCCRRS